jgi:hypothetical protein
VSPQQRFALVELLKWHETRTQDCWFSPRCYPMDRVAHNTWAALVRRGLIERRGEPIVIAGAVLIRRPVRLTPEGRRVAEIARQR